MFIHVHVSVFAFQSCHTYLAGPNQHRLSGHSYESSTSLRQSYHSSSSSLGSMDRLDDGGGGSGSTYSSATINVCKLLSDGVPVSLITRNVIIIFNRYVLFRECLWPIRPVSKRLNFERSVVRLSN